MGDMDDLPKDAEGVRWDR